jgi:hypothetical protein
MCIQRDYKDTVLEKVFKTDVSQILFLDFSAVAHTRSQFFQLPGDWSHKPPSF